MTQEEKIDALLRLASISQQVEREAEMRSIKLERICTELVKETYELKQQIGILRMRQH